MICNIACSPLCPTRTQAARIPALKGRALFSRADGVCQGIRLLHMLKVKSQKERLVLLGAQQCFNALTHTALIHGKHFTFFIESVGKKYRGLKVNHRKFIHIEMNMSRSSWEQAWVEIKTSSEFVNRRNLYRTGSHLAFVREQGHRH